MSLIKYRIMNIVDKLNNTLGYLKAMSFDKPELSNELVEPLNTLSEVIIEVENLSLPVVSKSFCECRPTGNIEAINKTCCSKCNKEVNTYRT